MPQQKESTSSKFVARLREISRGVPTPFGFVGRAQARQTLAMLLVASLPRNDSALVEAAIAGGADAVLAHLHIGEPPKPPEEAEATAKSAEASGGAEQPEMPTVLPPTDEVPGNLPASLAPSESAIAAQSIVPSVESPIEGDGPTENDSEVPGPAAEPSDVIFGGLDEERERLTEMVRAAGDRPVGVVVGTNGDLTLAELEEMAKLGVDFVAVYPHRAPASLLSLELLGHVARLDPGYPSGPLRGLAEMAIDAFAVSAGRPRESLASFTVHDMASFRQLLDGLHRPVMLASSWEIRPEDLKFFHEQGIEALILTPHVLGESAESVREKVAEFQKAIASLGPPVGRGRSQEGRRVVLPRMQPAESHADEDDDDDDEDDDD